mgnify:FL=1
MGIPLSEMPLWDPYKAQGGATDPSDYAKAKMILWKGFCSVHQRFTVEQIEKARAAFPGVKVIVHPECSMQVVDAADGTGSTAYIVKEIANAPAGSAIAVGTEINLVNRLAAQYPDKTVFCLDPVVCPCSTMYRIHRRTSPGRWRTSNRATSSTASPWTTTPHARQRWLWSACSRCTRDRKLRQREHINNIEEAAQ